MENSSIVNQIEKGKTFLGIEFGSTEIKAVLLDENCSLLAGGFSSWKSSKTQDGFWSYPMEAIIDGLRTSYRELKKSVRNKYGVTLRRLAGAGISGMMHGYLVFDGEGRLLTPFRTWQNVHAVRSSARLEELFHCQMPMRWSICQLYQAVLDGEEHCRDIRSMYTLAAYIHYRLTGEKNIGIGDASGMFPIDGTSLDYDRKKMELFNSLPEIREMPWRIENLLPHVMTAGERAGTLTEEGARFLDPDGDLEPGVVFCPPEGDGMTGMIATDTLRPGNGNISVGTSVFSMVVLDKGLTKTNSRIECNYTPSGRPTANIHCNNCTMDLNEWIGLFREFADGANAHIDTDSIYSYLFHEALRGDDDCGGLLTYNFFTGEPVVGLADGRPMMLRLSANRFNLRNLMKSLLFSSMACMKSGFDLLRREEKVELKNLKAHGGIFQTEGVAQPMMASMFQVPVSVNREASLGGAWGIAVLAAFAAEGRVKKLEDWVDEISTGSRWVTADPDEKLARDFASYYERFIRFLPLEDGVMRCAGKEKNQS